MFVGDTEGGCGVGRGLVRRAVSVVDIALANGSVGFRFTASSSGVGGKTGCSVSRFGVGMGFSIGHTRLSFMFFISLFMYFNSSSLKYFVLRMFAFCVVSLVFGMSFLSGQ